VGDERFVAYRRSSTPEQTIGLEMQETAINQYIDRTHGDLVAWYQDVGSASPTQSRLPKQQPQLVCAISRALAENASLIVARLDRLTRSTAVLALLLESGPHLLVVETPNASPFVLQIYAAAAEEYRRQVSRRVKAGIAAAQAKGRDTHRHAYKSGLGNRAASKRYADQMHPVIESIRRGRRLSQGDVAKELNARGLRTIRGGPWTDDAVALLWEWFHRRWSSTRFRGRPSSSGADATAAAQARAEELRTLIRVYRERGARNAEAIMTHLNKGKVPTVSGRPWTVHRTRQLIRRLRSRSAR
jgi:DNA invertase Pin-like site-specific DNA recombinase